jgi:hypothetical protein
MRNPLTRKESVSEAVPWNSLMLVSSLEFIAEEEVMINCVMAYLQIFI